MSRATGKHIRVLRVQRTQHDLRAITQVREAGTIVSFIDREFPLRDVAQALRYLGEGQVKGKVVIIVDETNHT